MRKFILKRTVENNTAYLDCHYGLHDIIFYKTICLTFIYCIVKKVYLKLC